MSEKPSKLLKFSVKFMGILLILGFIWVGVAVSQRAGKIVEATNASPKVSLDICSEITLPKISGAKIDYNQGQWIVSTRNEILRYNECGELIQRATLKRKK